MASASTLPLGDDDRARAHGVHFLEDMRRHDDGLVLRHRIDQAAHFVFLVRIEAVGRLVENQHGRIVHDRLGQTDAALEALRQGIDRLFEHAVQMQAFDHIVDALRAARAGQAAHVGDESEELARRHFAVARRAFGQIAEHALGRERLLGRHRIRRRLALPEVGARKPAIIFIVVDLPAPLGPRKPSTWPGLHLEGNVVHGGQVAVTFGQVAGFQSWSNHQFEWIELTKNHAAASCAIEPGIAQCTKASCEIAKSGRTRETQTLRKIPQAGGKSSRRRAAHETGSCLRPFRSHADRSWQLIRPCLLHAGSADTR